MPSITRSALVNYTPAHMYRLVNDVESYPAFLPWCRSARVDERAPDEVLASVEIAKGRLRKSFTTRNTLTPDRRIEMQLVQGPFRRLQGEWRFEPRGESGCEVSFSLNFEYANALAALTIGPVFGQIADSLVSAFCRRAHELYDDPR